jgi:hypothetical protein
MSRQEGAEEVIAGLRTLARRFAWQWCSHEEGICDQAADLLERIEGREQNFDLGERPELQAAATQDGVARFRSSLVKELEALARKFESKEAIVGSYREASAKACREVVDLLKRIEEGTTGWDTRKERPSRIVIDASPVRKQIKEIFAQPDKIDLIVEYVSQHVLGMLEESGYFRPAFGSLKERALRAHARCDFASPEDRYDVLKALKSLPSQQSNDS